MLDFVFLLGNYLGKTTVFLFTINFVLLFILIYMNRNEFKNLYLNIEKIDYLLLFLIFFLALGLRLSFSHNGYHMFYDEAEYMQVAKNISTNFFGVVYYRSIGWPFILAIVFKIFGISTNIAFYTNKILGSLTIFNIFFLSLILTKRSKIALCSAFLFSLLPLHIKWSGGAERNVPALFFFTLVLFFCLLYFRQNKDNLLWLSLIGISLAVQFRPENYVLFIIFFLGMFVFKAKVKKNIFFIILLVIVLSLPNLINNFIFEIHLGAWKKINWGGDSFGKFLGISNLIFHTKNAVKDILNDEICNIIFALLVLFGIIYFLIKKKRVELFFLGVWFFFIYISAFSIYKNLGQPERMLLHFYPILTIFSGTGLCVILDKIKKRYLVILIIFFLIFTFLQPLFFHIPSFYELHGILMAKIPKLPERDLPADSIIIENYPTMLTATTNLNVISLDDFLNFNNKYTDEMFKKSSNIFFFEDYHCFAEGTVFQKEKNNCKKIKELYNLLPFKQYSIKFYDKEVIYSFYKVAEKD